VNNPAYHPHSAPSPAAIYIDALTFSYPGSDTLIHIPHWKVQKAEHVFLSGASGSGKSTLLNLICGTLTPTSGQIKLLDQPFSSLSGRRRDRFRAQHIGVVFQQFNLIDYLTVKQNIEAAVYFSNPTKSARLNTINERLPMLLEQLKLPQRILETQASNLSVGQQQRVAIVRALINNPAILIVDEPTSALDVSARDMFMQLLKKVAAESTMIFVSHDPSLANYFETHIEISLLNRAGL